MLRGGLTLDIGWAVAVIAPLLMWVYLTYIEKKNGKGGSNGPYVDGKLTRKNRIVLRVFLIFAAVMVILTIIFAAV